MTLWSSLHENGPARAPHSPAALSRPRDPPGLAGRRQRALLPLWAALLLGLTLLPTPSALRARADVVGGEVFLKGTYIEVGEHQAGSFGTSNSAPSGFHPIGRSNLGFVADVGADGWTTGTPAQSGDFFLPGSPYEGWSVKWGTANKRNYGASGNFEVPLTSLTESSSGSTKRSVWTGTASNGSDQLRVIQTVSFDISKLYFVMNVQLTNVGSTTLSNVRYMRSVDPDMEVDIGGEYSTSNYVRYQPGVGGNVDKALVVAVGQLYGVTLGLGSIDSRARVSVETSWPFDPDEVLGSIYAPSPSSPSVSDSAISLAYSLGNLAPGQTASLDYTYILRESDLEQALGALASVTILQPTGSCSGSSVVFQATTTDVPNTSWIDFTVGGVYIGRDSTPSGGVFEVTFDSLSYANGPVELRALAHFGDGHEVTKTSTVNIDNSGPPMSFITPTAGQLVSGSGIPIQIGIDAGHPPVSVSFFRDSPAPSVFLGTDTSAPFESSFSVTDLPQGSTVVIKAVGTDSGGRQTTIQVSVYSPSNTAPVANPDSYSTSEDTLLNPAAPGVLGNDTDAQSDPLTASLVSGPSHAASFTLNSNGSFSYQPAANYSGADAFVYRAYDGAAYSGDATVTLTVNAVDDPPVLTCSGSVVTYVENGAAVVVDPGLTLTDVDGPDMTGARVSIGTGFASGQDYLDYATTNGVTGSYDAGSGVLTLSGTRPVSDYQAALRAVQYHNSSDAPSTSPRTIIFSLGQNTLYYPATGHYYEFVSSSAITWYAARDAAASRTYYGLRGYLVTVTSSGENTFVSGKLQGQGWMGATDEACDYCDDTASENHWRWATGPEAGSEFFFGRRGTACPPTAGPTDYLYSNWASGEPNDWGCQEDHGHFLESGAWNDYRYDNGAIAGYVVEYGGMPGDPSPQLSCEATVNVQAVNDAPVNSVPGGLGVNEDTNLNGLVFSFTDADEGGAGNLQFSLSASHGNLTLAGTAGLTLLSGGNGTHAMSYQGTRSNILAALNGVTYRGDLNYNGSDSISFGSNDNGNSGSGGALSDTDAVAVTVNPVNDAPVLVAWAPSFTPITEDQTSNPGNSVAELLGGSVTDVDAGAVQGMAVYGESHVNGTWQFSTDAGATWTNLGAVSSASALLLRPADRLRLLPDALNGGSSGLSYYAWDQTSGSFGARGDVNTRGGTTAFSSAGDTAALAVSAVNDAPLNTVPGGFGVNEDSDSLPLVFQFSDVDEGGAVNLLFSLSASHGDLSLASTAGLTPVSGGNGTHSMSYQGTRANILAALNGVTYHGDLNDNGADTISFTSNDNGNTGSGGALSDTDTVAVTVNAINDAPMNSAPGGFSVNEDTDQTGLVFSVADVDLDEGTGLLEFALSASHGNLTLAGTAGLTPVSGGSGTHSMAYRGTLAGVNAALNGVTYRGDAEYNAADTLSFVSNDLGNSGVGGALADTDLVPVTIHAVNDAPVAEDDGATTNEDVAVDIAVLANDSDVELTRGEAGLHPGHLTALRVMAVGVPDYGSVTTDGTKITYTPLPTFRGLHVFTYTVSDGLLSATAEVGVIVNPVTLLTLEKSDATDPVYAGWKIRYRIRANNPSSTALPNLVITDVLPLGTTFNSCNEPGHGLVTSRVVTWTIPSLSPQATLDLALIVDTSLTLRGTVTNRVYGSIFGQLIGQDEETTQVNAPLPPAATATPTLVGMPSPTGTVVLSTATRTPTASATASPSPSTTATGTATASATETATPTAPQTPTSAATETATETPTAIGAETPTATPSGTPQDELTPTPSGTPQGQATPTPTLVAGTGGIQVLVWQDLNRDGSRQALEPPLEGALIELLGDEGTPTAPPASSALVASCVTGPDGICTFFDLPTGDYWLVETNPHGMISTSPDRVRISVLPGQFVQAHFGDWTWKLYLPLIRRGG